METLILLLAVILITATVVGVLFVQLDFFSNSGFTNTEATKDRVSTGSKVLQINGYDGRDGYFSEFQALFRTLPDTEPIKLNNTQIMLKTKYDSIALSYREGTPARGTNGYVSYGTEEFGTVSTHDNWYNNTADQINNIVPVNIGIDLDNDGVSEEVYVCDGTNCPYNGIALAVNLSSQGIHYAFFNDSFGSLVNVSGGDAVLDISKSPIGDGTYGFISIKGTMGTLGAQPYTFGWADPVEDFYFYKNPQKLSSDLDGDNLSDYMVLNSTHVMIFFSSDPVASTVSLGTDISTFPASLDVSSQLLLSGASVGTITLSGSTTSANVIPDSASFNIVPLLAGTGYYMVTYLDQPTLQTGLLARGDTVRVYIDTPYQVGANEEVGLSMVVTQGVDFPVTLFTGHTIPYAREVLLYPKI